MLPDDLGRFVGGKGHPHLPLSTAERVERNQLVSLRLLPGAHALTKKFHVSLPMRRSLRGLTSESDRFRL